MLEFYHPKSPLINPPKPTEIQPKGTDFFNSKTPSLPKFPTSIASVPITPSSDSNIPPNQIQTHLKNLTNFQLESTHSIPYKRSAHLNFPPHSVPVADKWSTHSNFPPKNGSSIPRNPTEHTQFQMKSMHLPAKNSNFQLQMEDISPVTLQILAQIYKQGPNPDLVTYTTFIKFLGNLGHASEAFELFNLMKKTHKPDIISFTILIRILCESQRFDQAIDLIREMTLHNCKPDIFCYNTLINKFGEAGCEECIHKLWCKMKLEGISPDIVTYSSLVKSLCIVNKIDRAIWVLAHMEACQKIKVNTYVYNAIIKALLDHGRIGEALAVLGRMEIRGCHPDLCTFNLFIRYFHNSGHSQDAYVLLKEMIRRGMEIKDTTYKICIVGLIKEGKYREVTELIEIVRISCVCFKTCFWNSLILWLGKMRRLEEAHAIFMTMKNPNEITLNVVISMFFKNGKSAMAWDVFNLMRQMKIQPSIVTYNILINGLQKEGRVHEAFKLVGRMELDDQLSPDVVTYNCLLDGLCKAGEINNACRLILEMARRGCGPDLISYNTLINGLISVDRFDDACCLFEHMRGKWAAHTVPLERLIMEMVEKKS